MIYARLETLEKEILENDKEADGKLKVIRRFQEWLRQVDRETEIIPINHVSRVNELMASLKGEALTREEQKLVEEIVVS